MSTHPANFGTIKTPERPRFLFAPDAKRKELYIVHTQYPLSLIWVQQTIPARLFIVETEIEIDEALDSKEEIDDKTKQQSNLLHSAADWYRKNSIPKSN